MVTAVDHMDNVMVIMAVNKILGIIVECKAQGIIIRQQELVMMIGHKALEKMIEHKEPAMIIGQKALGMIIEYISELHNCTISLTTGCDTQRREILHICLFCSRNGQS